MSHGNLEKITAHLEQENTNGAPSVQVDGKGLIHCKLNSVIYGKTFKIIIALSIFYATH
jgi:hypothetical protein